MTEAVRPNSVIVNILISRVLLPASVEVKHLLLYMEDSVTLVEVGVREVAVVREELILKVAEANHIVASPVLIEELATSLLVDILKSRFFRDYVSLGV